MIAILYICTGKYDIFWKNFYRSAQEYLFPGLRKKYFVFTDAKKIFAEDDDNVTKIYQKNLGWPYNTLLRFEMFLKAEQELKECDYIFFFNANIVFLKRIEPGILPDDANDGLVAVLHPGFWNKSKDEFTYDRNPSSTACIASGDGNYYFMGGVNGGTSKSYLKLINTLNTNIEDDLKRGVIALWHDESHLNRYLLDKNPKILSPEYGYPEGWDIPFKAKLVILDKGKYGGHNKLRNGSVVKRLFNQLSIKVIGKA